jgi:ferredoxin
VLQPASFEYGLSGWMKPQMDFSRSYCDYDCVQCTEVCPGSALQTLPLAEKHLTRVGLAQLNPAKCIVQTKQTTCTRCIDSCPTKAIETVPFGPMLRLPQVKALLCIGCGRCEYECPVQPQKAIVVSGLLRETHVRKLPQKTAI